MQIEIFTICDSAQVYAGKAVITGAFNQLIVQRLPFNISLTLAVRIAFEKEESSEKTFLFCVKKPDGTLLVPELKCETKPNITQDMQESFTTFDLNIGLEHIVFNQFGFYTVTMRCDGKDYLLKFLVKEA